jgi:hypothetical protein
MAISRLSTSGVTQGLPKYQSAWDGVSPSSALVPIASQVITSNTATVTFTNIPQEFADLRLVSFARTTFSNLSESLAIRWNSDSSSIYSAVSVVTADTIYHGKQTGSTQFIFSQVAANTATAGIYSTTVTDIINYSNTTSFKSALSRHSCEYSNSGSSAVGWYALLYRSTNAVTSFQITSANGANIMPGSTFTLYGVRRFTV